MGIGATFAMICFGIMGIIAIICAAKDKFDGTWVALIATVLFGIVAGVSDEKEKPTVTILEKEYVQLQNSADSSGVKDAGVN